MNQESLLVLPPKEYFAFELSDLANATDDEFNAMIALNKATTDWVNGKINSADYTDILQYYDMNQEQQLSDIDWYFSQLIRQ